jgi:hypothetical protein
VPALLLGCDFSSAPGARKPIVLALGCATPDGVALRRLERFASLEAWRGWLADQPAWVGAFDFPFGLPRELVEHLGWPRDWVPLMRHYAALDRATIRATFAAFCDARPAGAKFAHRACYAPAGASPSMKWVNPPVAYMLHAGVPPLLDAGVHIPGRVEGDRTRVALEAYPGLLARELIDRRSYKADERARQTPERLIARKDIVEALEQGRTRLGIRLALSHAQRDALVADPMADRLDAVLCLMQAAWASTQPDFGHPAHADPVEGWIVSA